MKKSVLSLMIFVLPCAMMAQGALDALRFSQYRYEGTAKSMAMGNAFTSLGGDSYAVSLNPASSAVYRYSEFVVTGALDIATSRVSYLNGIEPDNRAKFGLSNMGLIGYFPSSKRYSPVKGVSFGIAYNRLNNYNSRSYASGREANSSWLGSLAFNTGGISNNILNINNSWDPYTQTTAPWRSILAWNSNLLEPLLDFDSEYIGATENLYTDGTIGVAGSLLQDFMRETSGNLSEIVLNFGVNIEDFFYIGGNLSVQNIYFSDLQKYSETAENPQLFTFMFSNFTHTYKQTTAGTGVNLKLGAILNPVTGLRIGASVSTPNWLYLYDEWEEAINANYYDGWKTTLYSPIGEYNYRVTTPLRWNVGVSYVFGNAGLISVDYEGVDYSVINMIDKGGDRRVFQDENRYIEDNFTNASVLRAGLEVRPVSGFALRAGYNLYTNPERWFGSDTHVVSCGIGLMGKKGVFADLGIQKRLNQEEAFSLYSDYDSILAPIGIHKSSGLKILFSLGFRF